MLNKHCEILIQILCSIYTVCAMCCLAMSEIFSPKWSATSQCPINYSSKVNFRNSVILTEGMEDVPQETLLLVFSFLQPSDSLRVCLTCKNWTELWQDKALWKHFHFKFLGGKPHPPLLPKAWLKSVREFLSNMKVCKEPIFKLEFAIEQGRPAVIDKILTDHPSLLYPRTYRNGEFVDTHPLEMVAKHKDNLNALKVVWEHLIKTSSSDDHLQIPTSRWHIKKTAAQIARKATRLCVKALLLRGEVEMLKFLLSVSPDAKVFAQKHGPQRFNKPGYFSCPQYTPEFFTVLKSIGVLPTVEILCQSLNIEPLAHFLLDELDWKGSEEAVVGRTFGFRVMEKSVSRSVAKRVIQQAGDAIGLRWKWWATDYVRYQDVDVKVLKWLLKKSAETTLEPEFALNCVDIHEGKPKLIRFLIEKGFIEVNKLDSDSGKTLLHFAVEKNQKEMVKALMDIGADPIVKGKRGAVSPMAIARQRGQGDLVEIMKAGSSKQMDGKGKRKRSEKEEERKTGVDGDKPKGERNGEGGTKKRKVAQREKKPLTEEKQEEKKLDVQIGEQLKWICEQDGSVKETLKEVIDAEGKGFTVFPLKAICRKWKLSSPSQKRIDLLRTVSVFLEGQQALVQAEL